MSYAILLLKKGFKMKSNYLILLAVAVLIGIHHVNVRRINDQLNLRQQMIEERILSYDAYIDSAEKMDAATIEENQELIEGLYLQRSYLTEMLTAYQQKEDQKYLQNYTGLLKWQIENIPEEQNTPSIPGYLNRLDEQLLVHQELLERGITPEEFALETKGATFAYRYMKQKAPVIFTAVILAICTPIAVTPYFKRLNIERTYPVSAGMKLGIRVAMLWFFALLVLFSLWGISYLLGSVSNAPGSFQYPILHYSADGTWIEPLWQVSLKALMLYVFVLLSIVTTIQLIAQMTKTSLATLFLSLLTVVGAFLLGTTLPELSLLMPYLPTTYLSAFDVAEGVIGTQQGLAQINLWMGILVNIVYALAVFALCLRLETRQGGI